MECHTVFSSWFSYYWKIIDLSYYKCYVLSADILARGMPNERQTILLRMNNIDNQLLIFYREKGKFGCLWCGDVEKSTVGIPQFPSLPLKSCCRPLLVALFIGGMLYHYNKIWCSCSGCIFFSGWECFWPLSGKDYSNERAISLRFVRLILSQYKSENYFQNVTTMVTVANIVILDGRTACLA